MNADTAILLLNAAATWFMAGLIWFVQVVHYPLFSGIGAPAFAAYEAEHQRRTTRIVAPVMLIELATTGLLSWRTTVNDRTLALVGASLLAVIWASTWLLQVPLHARLSRGLDKALVNRLVLTNWVRTVAWTGRALITLVLLARLIPG